MEPSNLTFACSSPRRRARAAWLAVLVASLLFAGGCAQASKTEAAAPAPPPPTVYVAKVERRDLALTSEAVATLDGYVNAEIRARVRGFLKAQSYKDGGRVKAGDPMFAIEGDQYNAAVKVARATVARAKAADARDRVLLQRSEGLSQTGMLSQQDLDDARTGVADSQGRVEGAQAELSQAELNLSYTQVRSPISGVAGVALVRIGNLVGQDGPTLLTTVSQLDPMRVSFALSELDFVRDPKRYKGLDGRDLRWAQSQFSKLAADGKTENGDSGVELLLADGSVYPHRGVVVAVDRQIDATTGTITLQALIPNPDGLLRPGQYGRVRLPRTDEGHDALVVPEKALIYTQGIYSLGVVDASGKVALRPVEVGERLDGLREVKKGVNDGETIVIEGVQKISDGAQVRPEPVPPEPAPARGQPATDKPKG
ncbi:MAG TPA: efflux RND transporter periplasmic adaptor subunit [Polyangiales bacterium]|nr:efflux RND transporter periplasmic adaptor subunit [Polyangiales bacterium]